MLGRESELARGVAVADAVRGGTGRLLQVTGEAGSGKSTLLAGIADRIRDDGFTVWSYAATRPEQALSWVGVAALLDTVDPAMIAALPGGPSAHIRSIIAPDAATIVSAHGVAVALRDLLVTATRAGPLAIVLDDEQWFDSATAGAVTFFTRSIADHPVVMIVARRSEERSSVDLVAVPDDQRDRIDLAGLPVEVVAELIRPIVGRDVARSTVHAIHERSAGNPMLALEIARQLAAGETLDRALVPRSIVETLGPRMRSLPPDCRAALGYAALLAVASTDVISAALGTDAIAAIAPAEADGLVELIPGSDATTVRFLHPTFAAAALAPLTTVERRRAHARLAELVGDVESRGAHLAAAVPPPSDDTAAALETAGELADRRGAPAAAARLYRASVDATPAGRDADRHRRLLALAKAQHVALQHRELLSTLGEIDVPAGAADSEHVAIMRVLPLVYTEGLEAARRHLVQAIESMTSAQWRPWALAQLVRLERLDDLRRGLQAAARAVEDAARREDRDALAAATVTLATSRVLLGEPVDVDAIVDDAAGWDEASHLRYEVDELVQLLWFAGDPRGVEWAERMCATAIARGHWAREVTARYLLGEVLVPRGEWAQAERSLRFSFNGASDAAERATLGFLMASTGRTAAARRVFDDIAVAETTRGRTNVFTVQARRAMAAFVIGDDDAVDQLELAHQLAAEFGVRAPRLVPYRRDYVEALVAAGRLDEARHVAEEMNALAERTELDSARSDANAACAVVASASGDDERARRLFADAAKIQDRDGDRYELARTLLAAGRAARRALRRTEARRHLDEAMALFVGMGAVPWVERCAAEAARIGGRPKQAGTLTPTERQIAQRAATGETNAEIAAAMFVSLRTVESNLSRCYRKLAIRSRVELAGALARLGE
ncbi:AAA family ATPase [Desertimonas flava]|uniref:AAA family ATPase n=1 Tax=Desertimonas flava TaxID=2064846 RepID=UPI001D0C6709|nr:LuxR family transcriptional regulator [Desertimonas flava]